MFGKKKRSKKKKSTAKKLIKAAGIGFKVYSLLKRR